MKLEFIVKGHDPGTGSSARIDDAAAYPGAGWALIKVFPLSDFLNT